MKLNTKNNPNFEALYFSTFCANINLQRCKKDI